MFREKNCRLHLLHWRWKQQVSPKCYLSTKIHGGTFQKTVILRHHAVKITYLNNHWEHTVMRYPIVHFCKSWKAFTNMHYRIWLSTHTHTPHHLLPLLRYSLGLVGPTSGGHKTRTRTYVRQECLGWRSSSSSRWYTAVMQVSNYWNGQTTFF